MHNGRVPLNHVSALQLAGVEAQLWLPASAVHHTHAALHLLREHALVDIRNDAPQLETAALKLSSSTWLRTALLQGDVYLQMGNLDRVLSVAQSVQSQARVVNCLRSRSEAIALEAAVFTQQVRTQYGHVQAIFFHI